MLIVTYDQYCTDEVNIIIWSIPVCYESLANSLLYNGIIHIEHWTCADSLKCVMDMFVNGMIILP